MNRSYNVNAIYKGGMFRLLESINLTEGTLVKLNVETDAPGQHHICQVDLIADEDGQGFFYFSDGKGRDYDIPYVIKGARDAKA